MLKHHPANVLSAHPVLSSLETLESSYYYYYHYNNNIIIIIL